MKTSIPMPETIEALSAAAHQRAAETDPRWQALAQGTLSSDAADALRQEAPDLYELYRPFDAEEQARILAGASARLAGTAQEATVIRPARWRTTALLMVAALTAACAGLWLVSVGRPPPLELAWSEHRGGSVDAPHLSSSPDSPHAKLTEVIVPVRPIQGKLAVRGALLVRPGLEPDRVRPWSPSVEPNADNAILVSGSRRDLFPGVPEGEWDMLIAVGRPGGALSTEEMLRLAGKGPAGDHQVLKKRVVLEGDCVGTKEHPCADDLR